MTTTTSIVSRTLAYLRLGSRYRELPPYKAPPLGADSESTTLQHARLSERLTVP